MRSDTTTAARWRPIAYVAVRDPTRRAAIADALHRQGWAAVDQVSGFHLLRSIADLLDRPRAWLKPGLIVVDAWSPGCSGISLAAGLRDLGLAIPIVLVKQAGDPIPLASDDAIHIVDAADAAASIPAFARRWSPARELDWPGPPERAIA